MSADPLVIAWIELQHTEPGTADYERLFWSFEAIDEFTRSEPARAIDFVTSVSGATDSDWILGNLAAGPLEDVLMRHPDEAIALLEQRCVTHPRLAAVLQGVWRNDLPADVWKRVEALRAGATPSNPSLERP